MLESQTRYFTDVDLTDYNAMKGQSAISQEPAVEEFGNEELVLAVPIPQAVGVVGVIYDTFTRDALGELLRTVRFGADVPV